MQPQLSAIIMEISSDSLYVPVRYHRRFQRGERNDHVILLRQGDVPQPKLVLIGRHVGLKFPRRVECRIPSLLHHVYPQSCSFGSWPPVVEFDGPDEQRSQSRQHPICFERSKLFSPSNQTGAIQGSTALEICTLFLPRQIF